MNEEHSPPMTLAQLLHNIPSPHTDVATEFGTKHFVWGEPLQPGAWSIVGSPSRHIRGVTYTYRRKETESNPEFEFRINGYAERFLAGSGGTWIEGSMTFSRHRYTEASLTVFHQPVEAPLRKAA